MIATREMTNGLQIPENLVLSSRVAQYIEINSNEKDAVMKKKKIAENMDVQDAENLLAIYQANAPIPNLLSVQDVAEILGVTKEQVLQKTKIGEIKGERGMSGRGNWRFQTVDFVKLPGFNDYLISRTSVKLDSLNLTEAMKEYIEKSKED